MPGRRKKGDNKIGTTGRGIGPAYEDKATRRGIRFVDLLDPDLFDEKVEHNPGRKKLLPEKLPRRRYLDARAIIEQYRAYAERLAPHVTNVSVELFSPLIKR